MSNATDPIPDDTIADLVQHHLIGTPTSSRHAESPHLVETPNLTTTDEIQVPYHLAGAAVTHDIYTHANHLIQRQQLQRSKSTNDLKKTGNQDDVAFEHLDKPGGFRRFHVHQQKQLYDTTPSLRSPSPAAFHELFRPTSMASQDTDVSDLYRPHSLAHTIHTNWRPQPPTRHFLEYLAVTSLMDHFAGEDLSDSDKEQQDDEETGEQTPLLPRRKSRRPDASKRTNTTKTVFLLFKAFISSGILFLPKAFSNGGLAFSVFVIWLMGGVSLYCFLLLLDCKHFISGSYGDIGEATYGPWMRRIVLFSIAISQLGFVCGGTIFIVQNTIEAIRGLSQNVIVLNSNAVLVGVCLLLMPLVLIRNIAKLSPTALLSDVLIIGGLLILLVYDLIQIFVNNPTSSLPAAGPNMIWGFNPNAFSVFVGTAVYSFEGIGLIIPIRDAMETPERFPMVLTGVMCMVAGTLCLVGTLGYVAFGSDVATVALLNLPPGPFPNAVQLGYAIAVHLTNVLAIFPTIRIVEQALFGDRTGKFNVRVKWEKNGVRFAVVMAAGLVAFLGANDLDKFISLIGSICCCPLSLIFPPLFHLKLPTTTGWKRLVDMVLMLFGVGVMSFTLYHTSMQWGSAI